MIEPPKQPPTPRPFSQGATSGAVLGALLFGDLELSCFAKDTRSGFVCFIEFYCPCLSYFGPLGPFHEMFKAC